MFFHTPKKWVGLPEKVGKGMFRVVKRCGLSKQYSGVEQWLAHLAHNQEVAGSNPAHRNQKREEINEFRYKYNAEAKFIYEIRSI